MIEHDWKTVKHFHAHENWGNWSMIDVRLPLELDKLREFLNKKLIVTCATQGTHARKSFHYQGLAVDLVVPIPGDLTFLDLFIAASRFDFHGIGLYTHWTYNGNIVPGLHLDIRQHSNDWFGNHRAHWIGTQTNGVKSHLPLKEKTLRELKIIQKGEK